ncbi:unnamed protein product [Caenorhabditis nigoni]
MYALYIIIGVSVVVVFIAIAICVYCKCCRQQDDLEEVVVSDSSGRKVKSQDSEAVLPSAPVADPGPVATDPKSPLNHPQVSSPSFPQSPPIAMVKPPYYEPKKEFKNCHRSVCDVSTPNHSRLCRRHIPYCEYVHQKEFKKSHRSVKIKREKSQKNRSDEDNSTPPDSQYSTKSKKSSMKSSRRSDRSSKMERTQTEEDTVKTDKSSKRSKNEDPDNTETSKVSKVSSRK